MFQLEMSRFSTIERLVSNRALIPMDRLKKGKLQNESTNDG
jgi:hypothetical protein